MSSTISCCELRSECVFPFVFFGFAAVSPSTQTRALVRHWLAQGTGDSCVHTCTQCTHPDAFEYMQDRNTHIDREIYTHTTHLFLSLCLARLSATLLFFSLVFGVPAKSGQRSDFFKSSAVSQNEKLTKFAAFQFFSHNQAGRAVTGF